MFAGFLLGRKPAPLILAASLSVVDFPAFNERHDHAFIEGFRLNCPDREEFHLRAAPLEFGYQIGRFHATTRPANTRSRKSGAPSQ